jgi:GNAT superfamily N-acetyltransferase
VSETSLVVRTGTLDDLDAVMALAMQASEENGFVVPDPEKILHDIYPALLRDRGIMGIIGEPGEAPQGAILLRIGENWYSREPVLEERAVFVHPDYRKAKGGRARLLVEFAKRTAGELDLPLAIGVLSNHRTAGKIRLYERFFGAPAGVYFLVNASTLKPDKAA